ncbi:MAG: Uncharacterized protein XD75_0200 [Parcubacteria bacterium 33_209]|jgi:thymidylate synthase|nr:MAG: Uncharacterized protein XD75_0200 [Parcubacteria bacterium 33_209]
MHNDNEQLISLVCGENIGSTWLNLVDIVLSRGALDFDEGRERIYLRSVVIRSLTQLFPDIFIEKYGKKENIDAMIDLMFHNKEMYDFDVVPSFSHGGQSYYARIKNWKMIDFVVNRLAIIPESKKAVMSFIRKEDYEKVLENPKDDYLPCITTIQFLLVKDKNNKNYYLNTLFNARSIDVYQKAGGNFASIALLSKIIAEKLENKLNMPVLTGFLDGLIADAHIYKETLDDAKKTIKLYKENEKTS